MQPRCGCRIGSKGRLRWWLTRLVKSPSLLLQAAGSQVMKYLPVITVIIVQQSAMIFFMRVVRLDLFTSAGLAAVIALISALAVRFAQRRMARRESGAAEIEVVCAAGMKVCQNG
jgi:hypothetical protein